MITEKQATFIRDLIDEVEGNRTGDTDNIRDVLNIQVAMRNLPEVADTMTKNMANQVRDAIEGMGGQQASKLITLLKRTSSVAAAWKLVANIDTSDRSQGGVEQRVTLFNNLAGATVFAPQTRRNDIWFVGPADEANKL